MSTQDSGKARRSWEGFIYFSLANSEQGDKFYSISASSKKAPGLNIAGSLSRTIRLTPYPDPHYPEEDDACLLVFAKYEAGSTTKRLQLTLNLLNSTFEHLMGGNRTNREAYAILVDRYPARMLRTIMYEEIGLPEKKVPHTRESQEFLATVDEDSPPPPSLLLSQAFPCKKAKKENSGLDDNSTNIAAFNKTLRQV